MGSLYGGERAYSLALHYSEAIHLWWPCEDLVLLVIWKSNLCLGPNLKHENGAVCLS